MISTTHRFIFIHVPKTGGNSVQEVLLPYSDDVVVTRRPNQDGVERFGIRNASLGISAKHAPLRRYRRAAGRERFESYFKFATVRNPWDRMISAYFSPHRGTREWDREQFVQYVESSRTIGHFLDARPIPRWARRFVPVRFHVDYVMKFENLQADFDRVCDRVGVPKCHLPNRNKSNRVHYSQYYDDDLIELVANRHAFEIRQFGYTFERG